MKMDFRYDDWFPKEPNVGYETLLYDVMIGDPTLFMRADMVEQAWRIVQPVLDAWAAEKADFPDYDSGSDGPKAADELLARDGERAWRPVIPAIGAEAHERTSVTFDCLLAGRRRHAGHPGQGADRGGEGGRARAGSRRHRASPSPAAGRRAA